MVEKGVKILHRLGDGGGTFSNMALVRGRNRVARRDAVTNDEGGETAELRQWEKGWSPEATIELGAAGQHPCRDWRVMSGRRAFHRGRVVCGEQRPGE